MKIIELKNTLKGKFSSDIFIADNAKIIGDVTIKEGASIWFNCVLRGDIDSIIIGEHTNIQDGCIVHSDLDMPTIVGNYVTVGHGAILHACKIEDKVLVGMGAIILDGAIIEEGVVIAAGAVITPGTIIPANTLVGGVPAKVIKNIDISEQNKRVEQALHYEKMWKEKYK